MRVGICLSFLRTGESGSRDQDKCYGYKRTIDFGKRYKWVFYIAIIE